MYCREMRNGINEVMRKSINEVCMSLGYDHLLKKNSNIDITCFSSVNTNILCCPVLGTEVKYNHIIIKINLQEDIWN